MAKTEPFETHTKQYEAWFTKNKFVYQSEIKAIKKQLLTPGIGIEIGVGTGKFAFPLKIKFGIEASQKIGTISQKKGIKIIQAIAEKLPLKNNFFDFCLMVTTICFLDDIKTAFKEVYRILKKDSSFIIGFVDKNSHLGKTYQEQKDNSLFYRTALFYSVEEVILFLKQTGFNRFNFNQTIFKNLAAIKKIEEPKKGYGEGSFVVISALKS